MGEAAVVGEAEGVAAKASEYVEIGSFSRERQRQRGQRCLAVQSGAPHARAKQKVGDGFQSVCKFSFAGLKYARVIFAGFSNVPFNSANAQAPAASKRSVRP